MKKTLFGTLLLGVMFLSQAMAGFTGPSVQTVSTVEEAKKMSDDAHVILRGNIEKKIGHEKYMFKDKTGTIQIEIDDDDWNGLNVSPEDMVEINGEVDTHMMKPTDIDVDSIRLVK